MCFCVLLYFTACMLYYCNTVGLAWWDWGLIWWLTILLQCLDTVGWVTWPVKISSPNDLYCVECDVKPYSTQLIWKKSISLASEKVKDQHVIWHDCYSLFTPQTRQDSFVLSVLAVWTQLQIRQDSFVLYPVFNFQVFSNPQYIWDWTVANWKLGWDRTKVFILLPVVFTPPTQTRQDKTVLSCPCQQCEQAITRNIS